MTGRIQAASDGKQQEKEEFGRKSSTDKKGERKASLSGGGQLFQTRPFLGNNVHVRHAAPV